MWQKTIKHAFSEFYVLIKIILVCIISWHEENWVSHEQCENCAVFCDQN